MAEYYIKSDSGTANTGSYRGLWLANQNFAIGDKVCSANLTPGYLPAAARIFMYECIVPGMSNATEPTWVYATPGTSTTTDNTVTWICRSPTTWANAQVRMAHAAPASAIGDIFYVSNTHYEVHPANFAPAWQGNQGNSTKVFSVDETSGEPPTRLAVGATVTTNSDIYYVQPTSTAAFVMFYGLVAKTPPGANNGFISFNSQTGNFVVWDSCIFEIQNANTSADFTPGGVNYFKNCTFKAATANTSINPQGPLYLNNCTFQWTTFPNVLIIPATTGNLCEIKNCDFSNLPTTIDIIGGAQSDMIGRLINCKFPLNWTGKFGSMGQTNSNYVLEAINSDSVNSLFNYTRITQTGTLWADTNVYRIGGAKNSITEYSWKVLTSSSYLLFPINPFSTPEITRWNEITGKPLTLTVHFAQANGYTQLTNKDIWMEVDYSGNASSTLGTTDISTRVANVLSTPVNHPTSNATWSNSGYQVKQKMLCTITPQQKGTIRAVIKMSKKANTVYIDPKLNITY